MAGTLVSSSTTNAALILQKAEEAIIAQLEGGGVSRYVIEGADVTLTSLKDLMSLRDSAALSLASHAGPLHANLGRPGRRRR